MRKSAKDVLTEEIQAAAQEMDPETPPNETAHHVDLGSWLQRVWDDTTKEARIDDEEDEDA